MFLFHPWKFRQQQHNVPQEGLSACWRGQISYPSALFGVKLFIIDLIQQMNYVSNQGWMYTMNWPISKSLNLEGKIVGFRKNWKRTSSAYIGMHSPLAFGEFNKSSHMSLYHLDIMFWTQEHLKQSGPTIQYFKRCHSIRDVPLEKAEMVSAGALMKASMAKTLVLNV